MAIDTNHIPAQRTRFDNTRLAHSKLTGLAGAQASRHAEQTQKVSEAKGRLGLAEEVTTLIEFMQERAHARSVGVFENLLSAILKDVLPHKGDVRLVLSTERGMPALDVLVENNGKVEDVLDGQGGAVTNVVVAGLRFAALSRTKNRRLMVLDEADCWLQPDRVKNFFKVIAEVAAQAKTQTFLISHHNVAYFEGLTDVVRLTQDATGKVLATPTEPRVSVWENDEQPGIRSVRLVNFRAHVDTTIPFSPGVTALIGDNDLGKSTALVGSLKAVAYGESDDTIFHHGATECSVVITLEGGKRIEWSRKLKGSPKVLYRLFHGEDMIHEGRPSTRGGVPEWVSDELGISRVDELDIQVGSQKSPIFLLDETPSRRAQLLSVGRESRHLHKFIERYRDWQRRDKETSREGEAELIRLNFSLAKLAGLPGIGEGLGGLTRPLMDLESQVQRDALLAKLLGRLDTSTAALGSLSQETTLLSILPEAPALADMTGLGRNIERLEKFTPRALVKAEFVDVAVPVIADTVRLGGAITHIAALEKQAARAKLLPQIEVAVPAIVDNVRLGHAITRLATLEKQAGRAKLLPPSAPATPELCPLDALVKTATAIERAAVALRTAEAAFKQLDAQIVELLFEIEQTKELTGGECPLCGAAFPEHGIEHKHNAPTAERLVA